VRLFVNYYRGPRVSKIWLHDQLGLDEFRYGLPSISVVSPKSAESAFNCQGRSTDSPFMQTAILYPCSAVRTYLVISTSRADGVEPTLVRLTCPLPSILSRALTES
jgi:hypothetical protein